MPQAGDGGGPAPLDWGLGHYETTAAQLEPAAAVVVERAALRAGERVLDLGCGTGNAALAAARAGAEGLSLRFEPGDAASIRRTPGLRRPSCPGSWPRPAASS